MKDYTKEIIATVFFSTLVFIGIISQWYLRLAWEFVVLGYFIILFIWGLRRRWSSSIYFQLSVIFLLVTIILDLIKEEILVEYSSLFIFYSVFFGFIQSFVRSRNETKDS